MKAVPLTIYLPDTKDMEISSYGFGNLKLGAGVFTYSRLAGGDATCPGATNECEAICYTKRITGVVKDTYAQNSATDDVPPIPAEAKLLRIHVSGDFDTREYINNWFGRLLERPDVTAWAYTRSWRVPELLPSLEVLRTLPNVQLFASMDPSCKELPPEGWRRAWIVRDGPKDGFPVEDRLVFADSDDNMVNVDDGTPSYVCPEETGRKRDCVACGYCFEGQKHDVSFREH